MSSLQLQDLAMVFARLAPCLAHLTHLSEDSMCPVPAQARPLIPLHLTQLARRRVPPGSHREGGSIPKGAASSTDWGSHAPLERLDPCSHLP